MTFQTTKHQIPAEYCTDEFVLRPLRATDVELDYAAVMESKALLRHWSHSSWPVDDFRLTDNLKDLQQHEMDHDTDEAYCFTVMNPAESECLGCVYVRSFQALLQKKAVDQSNLAQVEADAAIVSFWVRQSRLADALDKRLLGVLRGWFEQSWPMSQIFYQTHVQNPYQIYLFESVGMTLVHQVRVEAGITYLLYQ